MANDYIKLTTSGNERAIKASRLIKMLREIQDLANEVKDKLDHSCADPDYTGIEGASGFGVPSGQGQALYNLVASARARINHADIDALIDRVGE